MFLDGNILPDNKLINIASADAFHLGVLSSCFHACWALSAGGRLGVGNDPVYIKSVCFDTFPFPVATEQQKQQIRDVAEKLDSHRKQRQAEHQDVTLTDMYNVLSALRDGRTLTTKERTINDKAIVSVLKQYHDELDELVAKAYGWPVDADGQDILSRIVKLNAERIAEEKAGKTRWLRPEYRARDSGQPGTRMERGTLAVTPSSASKTKTAKLPWPGEMDEQFIAVREAIPNLAGEITAKNIAKLFSRANKTQIYAILCNLRRIGLLAF